MALSCFVRNTESRSRDCVLRTPYTPHSSHGKSQSASPRPYRAARDSVPACHGRQGYLLGARSPRQDLRGPVLVKQTGGAYREGTPERRRFQLGPGGQPTCNELVSPVAKSVPIRRPSGSRAETTPCSERTHRAKSRQEFRIIYQDGPWCTAYGVSINSRFDLNRPTP